MSDAVRERVGEKERQREQLWVSVQERSVRVHGCACEIDREC